MAFGLLSVFLPLYVIAIGGSLVDLGLLFAVASFLVIPSAFFWGYLCEKTRRYKRYILLSFLASAIFLYFFTVSTSVGLLIILYAVMSALHIAYEPPKNVLISELYAREEWKKTFAFYQVFTGTGWLLGLLLGFLMSSYSFGSTATLLVCSGLNLVAFILSLILVADPPFIFERSLVRVEKTIDFAYKGIVIASRILDGLSSNEKLRKENLSVFCGGLILFSLATTILFAPFPIFFSQELALPTNAIFAVYALNSGVGVVGYFLAGSRTSQATEKSHITKTVIFRSLLAFLLVAATGVPRYNAVLAAVILILMGFAYAFFLVFTLSLSMELIPAGKAGLFTGLVGIGSACGNFIGPFLAQTSGYISVFITAGTIFFLAYIAFKIST
jgi:MFS family permease